MQEFIETKGVMVCPPAAKYDAAPARAGRDDSDSDWLSRRREEPDSELSQLAKSKLLIMMRNLGGKPVEQSKAASGYPGGWKGLLRDEAYRWFFDRSDFEWWCEMAGFEPRHVLENARKVYDNGIPEMPKSMSPQSLWYRKQKARKLRELGLS